MTLQQLLFLALAAVILGSAVFVVTTRNLFRGALLLVLSFFGVAGMYVLLDAGFFAVAQVLVYIGAISILIIFGTMLTRGMQEMEPRNSQAVGGAILVAIVFAADLLVLGPFRVTVDASKWPILGSLFPTVTPRDFGNIPWAFAKDAAGNAPAVVDTYIAQLGVALVDVNQFALPFELASVLILLVLIGSIWVARERKPAEVIADRDEIRAEEADERAEIEALNSANTMPMVPETAVAHGSEH